MCSVISLVLDPGPALEDWYQRSEQRPDSPGDPAGPGGPEEPGGPGMPTELEPAGDNITANMRNTKTSKVKRSALSKALDYTECSRRMLLSRRLVRL